MAEGLNSLICMTSNEFLKMFGPPLTLFWSVKNTSLKEGKDCKFIGNVLIIHLCGCTNEESAENMTVENCTNVFVLTD